MPEDVKGFIGKSSSEAIPIALLNYWTILESCFHDILREYTLGQDHENIRHKWLTSVRDALKYTWKQHRVAVISGDAWVIRALVKSERSIRARLKGTERRNSEL